MAVVVVLVTHLIYFSEGIKKGNKKRPLKKEKMAAKKYCLAKTPYKGPSEGTSS
jgi:hypothetical protein